jgi:hypothetical protein
LLAAVATEVSAVRRPGRRTGRLEAGDIGRSNTLEMETIKEPVKQPRASTVPPERAAGRARANTEPGAPIAGRAPASSSFTELETDETVPGRPMGPMPARKPDIGRSATLPPEFKKSPNDVENAVTLPPGTPAIPIPTIRPPLVAPVKAAKAPAVIPPIKVPQIPAPPKLPIPAPEPPPTRKPDRAATAEPLPPPPEAPARTSSPRLHPRGSTPPQSLIVPAGERAKAEADLDRALDDITGERGPMMNGPSAELRAADRSEPEITVVPLSEPEIQISKLEAAADESDDSSDAEIVVERESD